LKKLQKRRTGNPSEQKRKIDNQRKKASLFLNIAVSGTPLESSRAYTQ